MKKLIALLSVLSLGLFMSSQQTRPAAAAETERIMIVGDSISHGSSGDYTWRYRLWNGIQTVRSSGVSLVGIRTDLFDNVNSTSGSQYYGASFTQKSHAAQWGSTFGDENPRVAARVRQTSATVAIVQLGTNDMSYFLTPSQTVAAADSMISNLRSANPSIDIVLGEVPHAYNPFDSTYRLLSEGAAYASGIRSLATRRSTSTSRIVVADTRTNWDAAYHTYDGVHPNPAGEGILASAYLRALKAIAVIPSVPSVPTNATWNVTGPAPRLDPGSERIAISWSRVSTGSSAMYIRYRFVAAGTWSTWNELPYPVGGDYGDSWNLTPIAGGTRYEVSLKPNKYLMSGSWGPSGAVDVTGPTPGPATNVVAVPEDGGARVSWTGGSGATAHYIRTAYIYDADTGPVNWDELPYPALGSSWSVYGKDGNHLVAAIQSVRGYIRGPAVQAKPVRVPGVAADAVQVYIGDSFIAGTGVPPYDDGCHRTPKSWPNLVLQDWTKRGYMLACEGSTMDEMIRPADVNDKHTGQLDLAVAVLKGTGNKDAPRRVFVSIGGNDVNFSDKMEECVLSSCAGREDAWEGQIDALRPEMANTFSKVNSDLPYADIYLLGYPSIVNENASIGQHLVCTALLGGEGAMITRLGQRLAGIQQAEANRYGIWANTSTVTNVFRGHEWCGHKTGDGWLNYPELDGLSIKMEPWTAHPNGQETSSRHSSRATTSLRDLVERMDLVDGGSSVASVDSIWMAGLKSSPLAAL